MTQCVVEFHFEILCLMDLVNRALRWLYPGAIAKVYTVSGDVSDIVAFSIFADLNDFAEAFDSECLLPVEMSAVT